MKWGAMVVEGRAGRRWGCALRGKGGERHSCYAGVDFGVVVGDIAGAGSCVLDRCRQRQQAVATDDEGEVPAAARAIQRVRPPRGASLVAVDFFAALSACSVSRSPELHDQSLGCGPSPGVDAVVVTVVVTVGIHSSDLRQHLAKPLAGLVERRLDGTLTNLHLLGDMTNGSVADVIERNRDPLTIGQGGDRRPELIVEWCVESTSSQLGLTGGVRAIGGAERQCGARDHESD